MEPIAAVIKEEEEQQQIKNEDNEIEQVENEVFVFGDHNSLSVMHDQSEYQKAENLIAFIDEQETVESKEAAETKELNKKCAEFITKMRERMRLESSSRHTLVLQT